MTKTIVTAARKHSALIAVAGVALMSPVMPAVAQEGLTKRLELPAHEALLDRIAVDPDLTPFVTDGCSGGMSDGWKLVAGRFEGFAEVMENEPPWEQCCVIHDVAYHNAGDTRTPEASFDARLEADTLLRSCVAQTGDESPEVYADQYGMSPDQVGWAFETVAGAMYLAVRFGGGPCTGLPWRWGFGFQHCSLLDGALKSQ